MCAGCKKEMAEVLNRRIRRILEIAKTEGPDHMPFAETQCFHLMELREALEGKETSGVYDDRESALVDSFVARGKK